MVLPGVPLMDVVAGKLGHPMGNRRTDPYLAIAVARGQTGLGLRSRKFKDVRGGSLTTWKRLYAGKSRGTLARALIRLRRRWYLRRRLQLDQGNTPWCMDATRCHWQLSMPVYGRLSHPLGTLYEECKKIDPWPGQDGTSAEFMLQVCQTLGLVKDHWWYTGPQDAEAAIQWLADRGGLWFGALWTELMFRTDPYGLVQVTDDAVPGQSTFSYGHEVFLIGRTPNYRRLGPAVEGVQSWGRENYGVNGRFWILERDLFELLMNPDKGWGDLVGVEEVAV